LIGGSSELSTVSVREKESQQWRTSDSSCMIVVHEGAAAAAAQAGYPLVGAIQPTAPQFEHFFRGLIVTSSQWSCGVIALSESTTAVGQ
jgi:hypothetical protein